MYNWHFKMLSRKKCTLCFYLAILRWSNHFFVTSNVIVINGKEDLRIQNCKCLAYDITLHAAKDTNYIRTSWWGNNLWQLSKLESVFLSNKRWKLYFKLILLLFCWSRKQLPMQVAQKHSHTVSFITKLFLN